MPIVSASEWNQFLTDYPDCHLLQTGLWGTFKSRFGWKPYHIVVNDALDRRIGVQVLLRRIFLGMQIAYIPKGPVVSRSDELQEELWKNLTYDIDDLCKKNTVIFVKIEPDLIEQKRTTGSDEPTTKPIAGFVPVTIDDSKKENWIIPDGFQPGAQNIQPRRTIIVSLNGDEERILGRMKQKTRYNVRLAIKRGVVVRSCTDLNLFYKLMAKTGKRDNFSVHNRDYYQQAFEIFHPRGMCELLLAEYHSEPLAAIMIFATGRRAWYFYGASSDSHRELMPTYLLQWEGMRWARSVGCTEYDLWGIPDVDEEELEANFTNRSDGLWGIYRFKRGFGGTVYRSAESWNRIYKPSLYKLYKYISGHLG